MAEIKWIKITTTMFDDEKIKLIDAMPERDTIFYIWIRLLVQAGKTNTGGYIFLAENIPYNEEMLSTIFNRQLSSIRLALKTLKDFGMIEIDNNIIKITNWDKHQNIEGMERVREQNRLRKQRQRENEKEIVGLLESNCHVTSRDSHETEIDREIDKEEDIDISSKLDIKESLKSIEQAYFNTFYRQMTSNYVQNVLEILEKADYTKLIVHAIELTKIRSKQQGTEKGFKYTLSILETWINKGYRTIEDVNKNEGAIKTETENKSNSSAYKPFEFED